MWQLFYYIRNYYRNEVNYNVNEKNDDNCRVNRQQQVIFFSLRQKL